MRSLDTSFRLSTLHTIALFVMIGMLTLTSAVPVRAAVSLPPGFQRERVAGPLTLPTALAFAPNGLLFVAEKAGVVRVIRDATTSSPQLLTTPFIDISSIVNNVGDRGLLGLTLHPNFPATPYVYLFYVYDPPGVTPDGNGSRVSRLERIRANTANLAVADTAAGSRTVLLGTNSTFQYVGDHAASRSGAVACVDPTTSQIVSDCIAADSTAHSTGSLAFTSDGALLVGHGDGASWGNDARALRSQNLDSLNGKILRIDPDNGRGLASNPFYDGNSDSNRSRVYYSGLRNPFRFAVDPADDRPVIGDVGWDSWEEFNRGAPGANFGWPCYEGAPGASAVQPFYSTYGPTSAACQNLYQQQGAVTAPVFAYDHSLGGASAQAGVFYTGDAYPARYRGVLFVHDYDRDWIKYLTFDSQGQATLHDFGSDMAPTEFYGPVNLISGPDEMLYYTDLESVFRITYTPGDNNAPTAVLSASVTNGELPLTVQFSSAGSSDPDGETLSYSWSFGDGATSNAANPSHTYTVRGVYTARLTVTDERGGSANADVTINAGNRAPSVTINTPADGSTYRVGQTLMLSGTASDPEDGILSGASLNWEVNLYHNDHVHPGWVRLTGTSGSFVVDDHGDNTWLEICLRATDSEGLARSVCRALNPAPPDTPVPGETIGDVRAFLPLIGNQ